MARKLTITADGGSRGNPGPAAFGAVVYENGKTLKEVAETIGVASNNVAEYRGLIAGLTAAHEIDATAEIEVRMDSKLVVEQMSGRWQIKHPDMKKLAFQARDIHPRELITFTWIPREENSHADRILNDVLDDAPSVVKDPIQQNFLMERLISGEEPTTIYLVRHGETILTPERKLSGSGPLNPELTKVGIGQAKAVALEIAKFKPDLIFASPLRRTQETAAEIAKSTKLEFSTEDIWIEQSFGKWDGMSVAEVSAEYPDEYKHWLASTSYIPPEGESYDEVSARALEGIDRIATDNPGKKIVVVTHNGIIKTAVAAIISARPESIFQIDISPCSITTISVWPSDNLMALRGCNERGHLRG